MQDSHFDDLVSRLGRAPRRTLLHVLGAAALSGLFAGERDIPAQAGKHRKPGFGCAIGQPCRGPDITACCQPGDVCCNPGTKYPSCVAKNKKCPIVHLHSLR